MSTFGAVISLLQFPLFVWESAVPDHAIWVRFFPSLKLENILSLIDELFSFFISSQVNIFCCVCTLVAYLNPLLLCFNKHQKRLIAEEDLMRVNE